MTSDGLMSLMIDDDKEILDSGSIKPIAFLIVHTYVPPANRGTILFYIKVCSKCTNGARAEYENNSCSRYTRK